LSNREVYTERSRSTVEIFDDVKEMVSTALDLTNSIR